MAVSTSLNSFAVTYYVDSSNGGIDKSGLNPQESLSSLQDALDRVQPGDTVIVSEGVYYGPVELNAAGTNEHPITLKAANRAQGAVVITNADKTIREGGQTWELVDSELNLYKTPLKRPTCRILYSGTDLQPYLSLESLKTFTAANGNPGPGHGYFFDGSARELYVRLHASGKYGSVDPSKHIMAVGSRTGSGTVGNAYNGPLYYNLGLVGRGAQHVIVDGFTFETPGFAGVFINGSDVVVRHCWFLGCRSAVSGRKQAKNPSETSNRVVIEYCDFSQYPAFDDMLEILHTRTKPSHTAKFPLYWWSRKGGGAGKENTYEIGICNLVGSDWIVRNNYIHDAFEGFATWGIRWSKGLDISNNRLERLVDNAIEMEDHASDMRIYNNYIINAVEPLSWQPLGGEPWPGPAYIYGNVIQSDESLNTLITEKSNWTPGWFKAGANAKNWDAPWNPHMKGRSRESVQASGNGIVVFNNTILFPGGYFLTLVQPKDRVFENFWFINNISAASGFSQQKDYIAGNMQFFNNVWINIAEDEDRGKIFAGIGGSVISGKENTWDLTKHSDQILNFKFWNDNFQGVPVPQAKSVYHGAHEINSVGASMERHEAWVEPIVGPQQDTIR